MMSDECGMKSQEEELFVTADECGYQKNGETGSKRGDSQISLICTDSGKKKQKEKEEEELNHE
ncbi:hypothetical protein HZA56_19635 [Candidatus Poribacteria bacterium]|nr:hypothetical protein [Candidatus Poribacteria bacterium]